MKYNKLVRDKIPDLIRSKGEIAETHRATDEEYLKKLIEKLQEEVDEFKKNHDDEELADVLEVVNAIRDYKKIDLESIREKKAREKGAFKDRIILDETK